MTSNYMVQVSSETNVEFKSYLSLDHALNETREIYETFASIVENGRPLPVNFSGSLFHFEVEKRVAKFFSEARPRPLEPQDFLDTPLEWTDVLRESLTTESFKPAPNGLYHCCVQGKWIEVTENDRYELLCGVVEALLDSLRSMPESRQRQKFETHFDETLAYAKQLVADMEKTKQNIQRARQPKGDLDNRDSHDLLASSTPALRDGSCNTLPVCIVSDIARGSTPRQLSTPRSITPRILSSDPGEIPDTVENRIEVSAGSDVVPIERDIPCNDKGKLPNREGDNLSVISDIPSAGNRETSCRVSGAINKEISHQALSGFIDAVSQTADKTVCQSRGVISNIAVGQPVQNTSVQIPRVVHQERIGQAVTNAGGQPPRTGAVFRTSDAVGGLSVPQQTNGTALQDDLGRASENVNEQALGQSTTTIIQQIGRESLGTIGGNLVHNRAMATQSTVQDIRAILDQAMVDEDYYDVESVGSDIPYDYNNHQIASGSNTAIAQFESNKIGDISLRLSPQARRDALVQRYRRLTNVSASYSDREINEAPEFIKHVMAQGHSPDELEDEYNWIFKPGKPRTVSGLFQRFSLRKEFTTKRKLNLNGLPSPYYERSKRLRSSESGITTTPLLTIPCDVTN
ncbi:unnamed protein product [Penicillium glandicola]